MKSYCNPLNLSYKYQHYKNGKIHREAADPTLVYFKGRYYIFASMSAGFYYSEDLFEWEYHENRSLDIYRYAPDVRQIGEYLYFCASDRGKPCTIYRSRDPLSDDFESVSTPFDFWDPDLFQDDDGKVYLYWGCDNSKPIYGIEMNPESMKPIGSKVPLITEHKDICGWERFNYPGKPEGKTQGGWFMKTVMKFWNRKCTPYIEGAYVNKWNGKYYLQYAAPATEYPIYGDGVYLSDHPLGPYTVQCHNPFSLKPAGFITGAGHGSTIEDSYGNLWHTSTMRISVHNNYERRVGLFPAGVDQDGILFCNQNFADYPLEIPEGRFDPWAVKPLGMLLSYRKKADASSQLPKHGVELAMNEDIRTWWCAEGGKGEWYRLDLGEICEVKAVQVNFADEGKDAYPFDGEAHSGMINGRRYIDSSPNLHTRYLLEGSKDNKSWDIIKDRRKDEVDLPHDYICLENPKRFRYIRVTAEEIPYGQRFALSGLRVFGTGNGQRSGQAGAVQITMTDPMTAHLSWGKAEGAVGYNIRFGIAPDKLYLSYMVYGGTEALLTVLNANEKYYFRVDSFNENGVTEGNSVYGGER